MNYTYDPTKIRQRGKDQMRFELGDTTIDGGAVTCALADEEYEALLSELQPGKKAWLWAKLQAIEAIMIKLQYQVDTKIDVLTYGLGKRAELWQKLYDDLRKEVIANTNVPTMAPSAAKKPPYFHTDMKDNKRVCISGIQGRPFRKMST